MKTIIPYKISTTTEIRNKSLLQLNKTTAPTTAIIVSIIIVNDASETISLILEASLNREIISPVSRIE